MRHIPAIFATKQSRLEDAVKRILAEIEPETHERSGLTDTPKRVAKMYEEIFAGYGQTGKDLLAKTFEDDIIDDYGGIVLVDSIPFHSLCEHHLAIFHGRCHIGYIKGKSKGVVGLSKLARLVEVYARRLQVQERLTDQIANDIQTYLKPKGLMIVMNATHTCMCARGAKAHGTSTTTSAVRGVFATKPEARAEFLALIQNKL